jgi:hypothetical protein
MIAGIVGAGQDKFTPKGEERAKLLLEGILAGLVILGKLTDEKVVIRSGHSIMKGIDIWAEEKAKKAGIETDIKWPKTFDGRLEDETHRSSWSAPYGYKARNLDIAASEEVYIIVADTYPPNFPEKEKTLRDGKQYCYHCNKYDHVKSGGCYTGKEALKLGNNATWHIVPNY